MPLVHNCSLESGCLLDLNLLLNAGAVMFVRVHVFVAACCEVGQEGDARVSRRISHRNVRRIRRRMRR